MCLWPAWMIINCWSVYGGAESSWQCSHYLYWLLSWKPLPNRKGCRVKVISVMRRSGRRRPVTSTFARTSRKCVRLLIRAPEKRNSQFWSIMESPSYSRSLRLWKRTSPLHRESWASSRDLISRWRNWWLSPSGYKASSRRRGRRKGLCKLSICAWRKSCISGSVALRSRTSTQRSRRSLTNCRSKS